MKKKNRFKPRFFVIIAIFLVLVLSISSCAINKISDSAAEKAAKKAEQQKAQQKSEDRAAQLKIDGNNGLFILVNKQNTVEDWYVPADLVTIERHYAVDREEQCRYMRAEAAEAFLKLADDAEAQGIEIVMTTAYRSYNYQNVLWTNAVARYGSEESANTISARPGQSEHQTGLAVDISSGEIGYSLEQNFGDTAAGQWVAQHAHEYGFILRYGKDKEAITGYVFEPWHLRYVGKTAAAEINQSGLALEEYLEQLEL